MSFIKFHSYLCNGLEKDPLTIEALRSRGLSQLALTGLPDAWLRDSRDKIRALCSAINEWGALDRVLVHLLPPERSKFGAHLELPIALAILAVLEREELPEFVHQKIARYRFVGSLNLEGRIQSTDWIDSILLQDDPSQILVGPDHFATLAECWSFLKSEAELPVVPPRVRPMSTREADWPIEGREWERHWLMAASLYKLPALLLGPPGSGKSTLARWAQDLMLWPSENHAQECRRIHRLAGLPPPEHPPRLRPHSRAHVSEFIGHGAEGAQKPGYFSLGHGGSIALDEFLEFNRPCREILRNVLDERKLLRNTRGGLRWWPADFWLVATSNPCACGRARGDNRSSCGCSAIQMQVYRQRLSGPLMDRFAVKLWVDDEKKSKRLINKTLSAEEFRRHSAEAHKLADELIPSSRNHVEKISSKAQLTARQVQLQSQLLAGLRAISHVAGMSDFDWPSMLSLRLLTEKSQNVLDSMSAV